MEKYPLLKQQMPENIKKVWRLRTTTSFMVFLILMGTGSLFLQKKGWLKGWQLYLVIGISALIISGHLISFLMVNYRYHFHRYEIEETDLAIQEGYLNRSTTYVPFTRIQHLETDQGIFLRKFNLVSLSISTAATTHELSGLTVEEAEKLKKEIMILVKEAKDDV